MKNIRFLVFSLLCILSTQCTNERFDMVLVNGTVYDGEGNKPVLTNIGITNGTIIKVGKNISTKGAVVVDAANLIIADVVHFMKKDYVMTSSDGHIEIPGDGKPHSRCYGAFTRKIRKYVIEDKVISMGQAIKAATSMPANMIGLRNRGNIKEGQVADIVIFNPETIQDLATFDEPHQYSSGVEYLLVNGDMVIENGKYNGKLSGKPVYRGTKAKEF